MNAPRQRTIAVFFCARGASLPLRPANAAHLLSWSRHSRHHTIYINVAYGVPWRLLRAARIDAVVLDTLFCSMHWSPDYFKERTALCRPIATLRCPKIAIVQDEFTNIDLVADFLKDIGVTDVLTCSAEQDWGKFYPRLDPSTVKLRTALTGYIDETRLRRPPPEPPSGRPIALGYRGARNPFWLGRQGMLKAQIGEVLRAAADRRGLATDINHPKAVNYLKGDSWFDFLENCRAVVGVEGGASINDHDGSIQRKVDAYLALHPTADFGEVDRACLAGRDGEVALACLSPRHLEAALTKTAQVLMEGHYNGVLEPGTHYIALKGDYSNIEEVLDAVMDDTIVDAMVKRTFEDVVASGKWTYRAFIRDLETSIIEAHPADGPPASVTAWLARSLLRIRARLLWIYAHTEATKAFAAILFALAKLARVIALVPGAGKPIDAARNSIRRLLNLSKRSP